MTDRRACRVFLLRLLVLAGPLVAAGCLGPGSEPYSGWSKARPDGGGFTIRYLAPPWEVDIGTPPPAIHLEVPFQHAGPVGLPDPPPAYTLLVTPGLSGATEPMAVAAQQARIGEGDILLAAPRPFETRSGLLGHEVISVDRWTRNHRDTFVLLPTGTVVHMGLECNDDADSRDVDDLLASLEAAP